MPHVLNRSGGQEKQGPAASSIGRPWRGHTDLTLKRLLSGDAPAFLRNLGIRPPLRAMPTEVFESTELRVDFLARSVMDQGVFVHIELQSKNDPRMLSRMMRYQAGIIHRLIEERHHQPDRSAPVPAVHQICVYVGNDELSMSSEARSGTSMHRHGLIDIRSINPEPLLASESPSDVVLSVLCRNGTSALRLRKILSRIDGLGQGAAV